MNRMLAAFARVCAYRVRKAFSNVLVRILSSTRISSYYISTLIYIIRAESFQNIDMHLTDPADTILIARLLIRNVWLRGITNKIRNVTNRYEKTRHPYIQVCLYFDQKQ